MKINYYQIKSRKTCGKKASFCFALLLLIILPSFFFSQGSVNSSKETDQNIIFIVIDTLRPDHLGCYGYERNTSPHIDSLASQGLLFKNTIAQAPWTKPSVASFFTSTLPSTHGVTWRGRNKALPKSMLTLAEILQQNGYKTAAFSDNPHITRHNGYGQGFDTFVENHGWLKGNAEPLTNKMLACLKENANKKHFIYIHYLDPHDPYQAPGTYRDMFLSQKGTDIRKTVKEGNTYVLNGEFQLDREIEKLGKNVSPPNLSLPIPTLISRKELDYLTDLYDGEIRYADYHLGRIISTLKELKTYDKTTIIITSDHAEGFLEHGFFRHGYHLYDETIKVPLIIVSPGFHKTPQVIEAPVNLIDLMPTILDLLDIPFPASVQGRSLRPLIDKSNGTQNPSVSETYWKGVSAQSVRSAGWKYISDMRNEKIELFNLGKDSGEKNNLYPQETKKAKELSQILSDTLSKSQQITEKTGGKDSRIEKRQMDKLKSLGYIL